MWPNTREPLTGGREQIEVEIPTSGSVVRLRDELGERVSICFNLINPRRHNSRVQNTLDVFRGTNLVQRDSLLAGNSSGILPGDARDEYVRFDLDSTTTDQPETLLLIVELFW